MASFVPERWLKIQFLFLWVSLLAVLTEGYVIYVPNTELLGRDQAEDKCKEEGGQLARVKDTGTLQKAKEAIRGLSGHKFWTGLRYHHNHDFTWNGNDPVNSNELDDVAERSARNGRVCYLLSKTSQKMEPNSCDDSYSYMCEKVGSEESTSPTEPKSTQPTSETPSMISPWSTIDSLISSDNSPLSTATAKVNAPTTTAITRVVPTSTASLISKRVSLETSKYNAFFSTTLLNLNKLKTMSLKNNVLLTTTTKTITTSLTTTTTRTSIGSAATKSRANNIAPTEPAKAKTLLTEVTPLPYLFSSVSSEESKTPTKEPLSASDQLQLFQGKITTLNASEKFSLETAANLTSTFLQSYDDEKIEDSEVNVLLVTKELEAFATEFGKVQVDEQSKVTRQFFTLAIQKVAADTREDVIFPEANETYLPIGQNNASVSLPHGLFKGQERIVIGILFEGVDQWVPDDGVLLSDGKTLTNSRIGSRIITSSMNPLPSGVLKENVTVSFNYAKELNQEDVPYCAFWNFSVRTKFNGSWSNEGCTLRTKTKKKIVCSCNHLTHFAVLMQVGENKIHARHKLALEIITYIGCGLSLLGESLTVLAYLILLDLKQEQAQIRFNLVSVLGVAQIAFLAGINASEHQDVCIFVAALMHFLYLVGFAWMLFEGIYLYLMVVKVFNTVVKMRIFYSLAWGVPLIIVSLSLVIAATDKARIYSYIQGNFCWISFKNNLIWTFAAPVLVVCLINSFILGLVVYEITKMQSAMSPEGENIRQGLKACAVLFPLLGMTWVFGILSVTNAGLVFQYIFTILNSLQGFFIFALHVLRSSEIQAAFNRKKQQWTVTKSVATSRSTHGSGIVLRSDTAGEQTLSEENYELDTRRNQVPPQMSENMEPRGQNRSPTPVDI